MFNIKKWSLYVVQIRLRIDHKFLIKLKISIFRIVFTKDLPIFLSLFQGLKQEDHGPHRLPEKQFLLLKNQRTSLYRHHLPWEKRLSLNLNKLEFPSPKTSCARYPCFWRRRRKMWKAYNNAYDNNNILSHHLRWS